MNWFTLHVAAVDVKTPEGLKGYLLNNLQLTGYGTLYKVFQGNLPLEEPQAKRILVEQIVSRAAPQILNSVNRALQQGDNPAWTAASLSFDPKTQQFVLDYLTPISVDMTGVDIRSGRRMEGNQATQAARQRQQELAQKLDETKDTSVSAYLMHANQCGYLFRNTRIGFGKSERMWASECRTRVYGCTIAQIRGFIDSSGVNSLSSLSTTLSNLPEDEGGPSVYAGHKGFAQALLDFLNLEYVVDLQGLMEQHGQGSGHSGMQSLEYYGASPQIVVEQLLKRRPDISPDDIEFYFKSGMDGDLLS